MKKKKFEVEVRSFISERDYKCIKSYLDSEAEFLWAGNQETYYFDSDYDLRLQRSDKNSKLWLKKGIMHASQREEIEILFGKKYFDDVYNIFSLLNYKILAIWFRKRIEYKWQGIKICLDDTKNYGFMIELEKVTIRESKKDRDRIQSSLKYKLESLKNIVGAPSINLDSEKELKERYNNYMEKQRTKF